MFFLRLFLTPLNKGGKAKPIGAVKKCRPFYPTHANSAPQQLNQRFLGIRDSWFSALRRTIVTTVALNHLFWGSYYERTKRTISFYLSLRRGRSYLSQSLMLVFPSTHRNCGEQTYPPLAEIRIDELRLCTRAYVLNNKLNSTSEWTSSY